MNLDIHFIDSKHMDRWMRRDDLVDVRVDRGLQSREVLDWLRANTRGEIHIYSKGYGNSWYGTDVEFVNDIKADSHTVRFEDHDSAMMFKLAWA